MTKTLLAGVLLIGSAVGCFSMPQKKDAQVAPKLIVEPLPPGPITADQVEATNAHRVAEAVWDEMDREQQNNMAPAAKDSKKR
jgi:hypothetical protein